MRWPSSARRARWIPTLWKRDSTKGCCSTFWAGSTRPPRPTSRWWIVTSHANGAYTDEEKNNRSIFLERLGAVYDRGEQDRPGDCRVSEDDRPGRQHCGARLPGRGGCVSQRARVRQGDRRGAQGGRRQSQGSRPEADARRRAGRPGQARRRAGDGQESARWRLVRRAARRLVRDRADGRAPAPLEGCRRGIRQGRSADDEEGRSHLSVLPARRTGRAAEALRPGRAVLPPGAGSGPRECHDAQLPGLYVGRQGQRSCPKR